MIQRLAGTVAFANVIEMGYTLHRFAHFDAPVFIPFAFIDCRVMEPSKRYSPAIHNGQVKFTPLINQEQMKKLWVPFEMGTVRSCIKLEWNTHYREIMLNIPYPLGLGIIPRPIYIASSGLPGSSSPLQSDADISPQSSTPINDSKEVPEPYPGSGQEVGEWWYEHHHHVKLCLELGDDDETSKECKRREAREREAERFKTGNTLPLTFNHTVFVWEPSNLHPIFLLRRRLSVQEARCVWPTIPFLNKIYNSYDEEWDLYHGSCDLKTWTRRPTADEDLTEKDVVLDRPNEHKRNPLRIQEDMRLTLKGKIEEMLAFRMPLFCEEDPLGSATRRFGFLFPNPPCIRHKIRKKDHVQWYYHLGYKDVMLPVEIVDQVEQTLLCMKEDHTDHLQNLLDIYAAPQALIDKNTVVIRYFPDADFEFSRFRQRDLYILFFLEDSREDWFFGLSQTTDLVFALREGWATSRESLVDSFLAYGMQFYMLAPVPPPSEIQHYPRAPKVPILSSDRRLFPDTPFTIPMEPSSQVYTMTDFYKYERRREQLFDMPYG